MSAFHPEDKARSAIDARLVACGWLVQSRDEMNLSAGGGLAVREFATASGPVDYALFVDKRFCGVVEAKPAGTTLSGFSEQAARYIADAPEFLGGDQRQRRFEYVASDTENLFRDLADPEPRSRRVFTFHRPETLRRWLSEPETLRARLRHMSPLVTEGLRQCQIEAIQSASPTTKQSRELRKTAISGLAAGGRGAQRHAQLRERNVRSRRRGLANRISGRTAGWDARACGWEMLDARDQAMIYWYDARSYARAAERLSDAEGYGATMVTYFAWSHAIELSLKAILIAAGWSIQECQLRLRHDLQKALVQSKSIGLVLSEATEQVVLTLSPLHAESHAFRYRPQSNYSFPRAPITQAAVDEIVGRVEEMLRKRAQDARG